MDEPAIAPGVFAAARASSSASLHEASGKLGALPGGVKPLASDMRLCGPALPVRCPPGDNLWIHHALAAAARGDVLVVETGRGVDFGYWGEIMATAAVTRGVAGLVITGGVRDSLALIAIGLPTFCGIVSIRGTVKNRTGDGAVGEPVRIGDVVVRRGDLVFGDADGVVVLGPLDAPRAVEQAATRDADEVHILEKIRAGALTLDVYKF